MKTVKVSEASGTVLDWLVAKCEEHPSRCPWMLEQEGFIEWQAYEHAWGNPLPSYSTDWARGGQIIERERLNLRASGAGNWVSMTHDVQHPARIVQYGETPLLAALRCYVVSKLGEKVKVPDELI